MITQSSYEGQLRIGKYPLEALERRWAEGAWEDADAPKGATKGTDKPDKNEYHIPNILIVDDDESFGHMLERVIVKLTGYDCTYVKDATKAVQVLEKSIADVVITDIRMPGMNGLELTRYLKGKYSADIIVITGYQEDFLYENAIDCGASDFIEKPIKPSELIIRLRRVLRERESSAKLRQTEDELRKMNLELKKQIEKHCAELLRINALHQAEINERKQAEEGLRQSRERYRLATDAAHEGIWDMDLINKMVRWNKTFSDQFGDLPDKRLSRQWWFDRIHPEDFDRIISDFTGALKGTVTTWNQEYRFLRSDGTYAHVLNRAYIERNKTGRAIKVYGAMLDITPMRQIEIELKKQALQLERANEELESFSYSVSHDLREPLRAIEGFARMLLMDLQDKLDDETKRKFDVIREKTRKMAQLIEDILTFSHLGQQNITATFVNWEKLVAEVWKEIKDQHEGRKVKLTISPLAACQGDEHLMRQVLTNLLSNAVKFTKEQGPGNY